MFVLGL